MDKFIKFVKENWKSPVAIGLYILIAVLIIYNWGRIKGSTVNKPNKLPKETDWGKDLTEKESEDISKLAQRLWRDMDSYLVSASLKPRDVEAYVTLLSQPDRDTVGTYNYFNDLYYSQEDGTLKDWIYDESFTYTHGASGDLKTAILQKFDRLNLKGDWS